MRRAVLECPMMVAVSTIRAVLLRSVFATTAVTLLGCATGTPVEAPSVAESPLPQVEPTPYRLQIGDRLGIRFWGNPELNEEVTIRPDGVISLPFVDEVQAAGLTPAELDAELTRRYTGELARPEITVMVLDFPSHKVFVGGEVGRRGSVELTGRLTLLQAIQEAGGFQITARRDQVLLIRSLSEGEIIARSIDLRPVLSGANPAADIPLQPLDVVFVPRTKIENVKLFIEEYIFGLLPIGAATTIRVLEN